MAEGSVGKDRADVERSPAKCPVSGNGHRAPLTIKS